MSVDVTDLVMQRYFINEEERNITIANKRLEEMWAQLRKQCTHPTTVTSEKYYSGGYDYISSVVITVTCTLCDKILKSYDDPKHKGCHS